MNKELPVGRSEKVFTSHTFVCWNTMLKYNKQNICSEDDAKPDSSSRIDCPKASTYDFIMNRFYTMDNNYGRYHKHSD